MKAVAKTFTLSLVFFSSTYFSQDLERANSAASAGANRVSTAKTPTLNLNKLWSVDIYGTIPYNYHGGGFGFGMFSPALNISPSASAFNSLQVRLGWDFYFAETGHKTFTNMPLSAPQTGDAKVRLSQNNLGFNLAARFSLPYTNKLTPYVDVFGGWRSFNGSMNITPNVYQSGYQSSTSSNLSSYNQWAYGGTIGVMYSLGKYVKLNTGLMYTTSPKKGEMVDVVNARNEANNIITQKINTPKDMLIFKVGLTFLMDFKDKDNCNCNCNHSSSRTYRSGSYWGGGSSSGGSSNHVNVNVRPSK